MSEHPHGFDAGTLPLTCTACAEARITELESALEASVARHTFDDAMNLLDSTLARAEAAESALATALAEKRADEDAACRLEELRHKLGLPEGTPEEIANGVAQVLDAQASALAAAQAERDAHDEALAEAERLMLENARQLAAAQEALRELLDHHGCLNGGCLGCVGARAALSPSQAPAAECVVNPVSSRACERGTKSCEVRHAAPAQAKEGE